MDRDVPRRAGSTRLDNTFPMEVFGGSESRFGAGSAILHTYYSCESAFLLCSLQREVVWAILVVHAQVHVGTSLCRRGKSFETTS
jgi:hypothetical protein